MLTDQEYIEKWLFRLQNLSNRSEGTVKQYRICLNKFSKFINGVNKTLVEANSDDIESYLMTLKAISTRNKEQSTICNFYNWMSDRNYCVKHPMLCRVGFKKEKRIHKFLEKEQWKFIEKTFFNKLYTFSKERDYVMVFTMINTGVRLSEVLNIRVKDLNVLRNELRVIGKGNKERIVQVKDIIVQKIYAYILKYSLKPEDYLFSKVNKHNHSEILKDQKLSRQYVGKLFDNISKKTAIEC
jgi:site-specific recombinase XerD